MTNREGLVLSAEFNSGTNSIRKSQTLKNVGIGENAVRKEINKPMKSASVSRLTKPTMELYRPPKNNQKNGAKVHFQTFPVLKEPSNPSSGITELKSALKRSKSFAGHDVANITPFSFDKDAFPLEYQGLIRNAIIDPNSLSCRQLMELVRLICSKAVESSQNASPAAQMCFAIIQKESAGTFLECLLNACREWYNERDKLLRSTFPSVPGTSVGGSRRWTTYISFLTELFLRLKSQQRLSTLNGVQLKDGSSDGEANLLAGHHALSLTTLLYECAMIILKPPCFNNVTEIECLRSMLASIGPQLEKEAPQRMELVTAALRDVFINPSITAQIRKTILELVELHASNWQLELSQSMYYFPYTSVDRH